MQELTPSRSKRIWLQRFRARLMQLQPAMNAVVATKHAVDTFHDAADLEPKAAAETFDPRTSEAKSAHLNEAGRSTPTLCASAGPCAQRECRAGHHNVGTQRMAAFCAVRSA